MKMTTEEAFVKVLQMHGIEQRTQEREHVYVWILGRWVPVSTSWLSS